MDIQVTTAIPGNSISGIFENPAPRGLGVCYDPSNPEKLIPANGVRGFLLERDVVEEVPLEEYIFDMNILTPVKVGLEVSARKAQSIFVEGEELVVLSGEGMLSSGTADNAELSYEDGRFRVKDDNAEVAGVLRYTTTPEDADNGARFFIEIL